MPNKKRMNYAWVFLLFSLSTPTLATASESSPAAKSHPQITQSLPVPQATDTIMPQVAPLFVEDSQRTSLITMVNSAPDGVDVDVILYKLSGEEVARQTVSMSPFSQRILRISDLLEDASVSYGSVFLVPNRKSTMAAQLSITSKAEGSALDIEEEFQMSAGSTPADYRATSVSAQPIIAVRSLSANSETLTVTCLGNDGSGLTKTGEIPIGPNQTLFIDACANGGPMVVSNLPTDKPVPPRAPEATAVSVSSSAPAMDLAVFGFGLSKKQVVGIPFTERNQLKSSTAIFPGVTEMARRGSRLRAAIANFGDLPHQATILISENRGKVATQKTAATVALAPHSTSVAELTGVLNAAHEDATLIVSSDAEPGEVLSGIQVASTVRGYDIAVTLPWKDQNQVPNGGQHPWRLDADITSTLLLYNPDPLAAANVNVVVSGQDGTPLTSTIDIAPLSTAALGIDTLLASGDPADMSSSSARTGMVSWYTLANPKILGFLVQADAATGVMRPFACPMAYVLCGMYIPDAFVDFGDYTGSLQPISYTCGSEAGDCICTESCLIAGVISLSSYSWSSQNSSIASLSSDPYLSYGNYLGAGVGRTYTLVSAFDNLGCYALGEGPIDTRPTVSIGQGNNKVPIDLSGHAGVDKSITLTATGEPSGGTYSWSNIESPNGGHVSLTNTTSATVTVHSSVKSTDHNDVTIRVTYTYQGVTSDPAIKTLTVVQPAYVDILTNNKVDNDHFCTGMGCYSYQRNVTYTIKDQLSDTFGPWNFYANEEFFNFQQGCSDVVLPTPSATVWSGITFTDHFWLCSSFCPQCGGSGCTNQADQVWYVNGYPVASKHITWACSDATVQ